MPKTAQPQPYPPATACPAPKTAQNHPFPERPSDFSPSGDAKRPKHLRVSPDLLHDRTHQRARGRSRFVTERESVNMPYLELGGTDLWYEDTGGNDTPVVFLHATTGNTEAWVHQLPAFTQAGYRCVTYDRRGWGRSRDTRAEAPIAYAADDLHALVQHLGLPRFHLISTAAGGSAALDYALSHPEELRSLVISHWSGGTLRRDPEYTHSASPYETIPEFPSLPAWFRELGPTYRNANPEGVDRWIQIEGASRHPDAQRENMHNEFTLKLLETIELPALMLASGADLYAAPPSVRTIASRISNCEFVIMPEAGHAAYWEQPDAWNQTVLDFVRRH